MKAAVYPSAGVVEVVDWPEPTPGPGYVKVKMAYAGICGSDPEHLHRRFGGKSIGMNWDGSAPAPDNPVPEGHEGTGTIVEVGPDLKGDWKPGQRVALNFMGACGVCYYCRTKREQFCDHNSWATGTFAEYGLFPEGALYLLPDDIPFELAVLTEPLTVGVHAVDCTGIQNGQTLIISGGGTIGLISLLVALKAGAAKILVSEPIASKRERALRMGADMAVDPLTEDLAAATAKLTNGRGFDGAIEASGKLKAAEQLLDLVDKGGTVVWTGVYPFQATVPLKPFHMYLKELTLRSTLGAPYCFERTINLLPKIPVGSLVTDVYPLDEIAEAFRNHEKGESIKTLLKI